MTKITAQFDFALHQLAAPQWTAKLPRALPGAAVPGQASCFLRAIILVSMEQAGADCSQALPGLRGPTVRSCAAMQCTLLLRLPSRFPVSRIDRDRGSRAGFHILWRWCETGAKVPKPMHACVCMCGCVGGWVWRVGKSSANAALFSAGAPLFQTFAFSHTTRMVALLSFPAASSRRRKAPG